MKEMGAPERRWSAEAVSNARQALTLKMGVQQRKNKITITINMRMTSFLAIKLAEELLLLTLSILVWLVTESCCNGIFLFLLVLLR